MEMHSLISSGHNWQLQLRAAFKVVAGPVVVLLGVVLMLEHSTTAPIYALVTATGAFCAAVLVVA